MVKRIKNAFIVLFTALFTFNSFASVISDNDGTTFVTKAEFEDLKNSFEAQIDSYNDSVDNKIDGAIAAYLAGIKIAKLTPLDSYLNENGEYGGFKEYWYSGTGATFDSTSTKYCYEDFTMNHVQAQYTMSVRLVNPEYISASATQKCRNKERDYTSSKYTKIKLSDGSSVVGLTRGKYNTKMTWSYSEIKPFIDTGARPTNAGYNWAPSSPTSGINNGSGGMIQDVSNLQINAADGTVTFGTTWTGSDRKIIGGFGWYALGTLSLKTDEVDYSYTVDDKVCPLSTAIDYYWDTTDDTSIMVHSQSVTANSTTLRDYASTATTTNGKVFGGSGGETAFSWNAITPTMYLLHTVPWCCMDDIKAQDAYLAHWNIVNNDNRQVKNGMILTKTTDRGIVTVDCKATLPGKLYLIATNTPISNWTASGFQGQIFNISAANTTYKCEYSQEIEKNTYIWGIYLPTSTSDGALLKIDSISLKIV